MRQARSRNDFVGGIGLKVQRSNVQADLARNGPDLQSIHGSRKSVIVESVLDPPS